MLLTHSTAKPKVPSVSSKYTWVYLSDVSLTIFVDEMLSDCQYVVNICALRGGLSGRYREASNKRRNLDWRCVSNVVDISVGKNAYRQS